MLRLLPAAVAAYELRYLITHVVRLVSGAGAIQASGRLAPLALILIAAASGLLLRESARGLSCRIASPTWSRALIRSWLSCSAGLGVLLVTVLAFSAVTASDQGDALPHAIGLGNWAAAGPALLSAGLLLALSMRGAQWLLTRVRSRFLMAREPGAVAQVSSRSVDVRFAGAPLRAGWSDRGPPPLAIATN